MRLYKELIPDPRDPSAWFPLGGYRAFASDADAKAWWSSQSPLFRDEMRLIYVGDFEPECYEELKL